MITRSPRVRRVLHVVLAVLAVYAVLKLTGVIEAIAPDRMGYSDTAIATRCFRAENPPSAVDLARESSA